MNKETEIAINMLKSGFAMITLSYSEADLILNHIKALEKKVEELTNEITENKNKTNLYNAQLLACWEQTPLAEIYRKYYVVFNGAIFPCNVYATTSNFQSLNAVPTYLNADIQLFIKGRIGLSSIQQIDYVTYKRVYSGV